MTSHAAHRHRCRAGAAIVLLVLVAASCSSGKAKGSSSTTSSTGSTATTEAPSRHVRATPATLEGPITTGEFNGPADPHGPDLEASGYMQEEYFASGTATAYTSSGELPADGRWTVSPGDKAAYKTRFVVRRPKDPSRFNGTVVVEWLNVTVVEAAPDWSYTGQAIVDDGAAWVGVSAQALGVMGGQSLLQSGDAQQAGGPKGLKVSNPERYGTLEHPGDRFSFDIFSQVGAALRSPGDVPVLGAGKAKRVIAAGESQSAGFLTGYIDGIHRVAEAYDGFFVHSRGAGAAQPDGTRPIRGSDTAYLVRTDLDVPVMVFETETDVGPLLRFGLVHQDDTARIRVWEVAGTAHADAYLVGTRFGSCPDPANNGPQHYVATAAMAATLQWVEDGTAPPKGDRIKTTGDGTDIVRDTHGLAEGGIRTPSVDVPVATLTGASAPGAPVLCALFGRSIPFDAATITSLYPSKDAYVASFEKSLDGAIAKGFVRKAERAAYLAEAENFAFPT